MKKFKLNKAVLTRPTFWIGILGAVKVTSSLFGFDVFTDEGMDTAADVLASFMTMLGVASTHK